MLKRTPGHNSLSEQLAQEAANNRQAAGAPPLTAEQLQIEQLAREERIINALADLALITKSGS